MPSFFLAFIACLVATLGAREAVAVARLSEAVGRSAVLLVVIWASAIASSAIAAWLGAMLAPLLFPAAKLVFLAAALLLGGGEILLLRPRARPKEPTRSAGAILLVLLAAQVTDAARFLVLALALATGTPQFAAAGGALASGVLLTAAWAMGGEWERRVPVRAVRIAAGLLLLGAGTVVLLRGLDLLG